MFEADPGDVATETTKDGDNPILLVRGLLNGSSSTEARFSPVSHSPPARPITCRSGMSPA